MSKIGEKPIALGGGVQATIEDGRVQVKGSAGEVILSIPKEITVSQEDKMLIVKRQSHGKTVHAQHGLMRSLIQNAVLGVVSPWEKRLEVVGTGYRVKLVGEDLVFEVGYSHPVIFKKVPGVSFVVEGTNKVILRGVDKQRVGEASRRIKALKKRDPYKGKGIGEEGEQLKLRPGKKAKTATGAGAK